MDELSEMKNSFLLRIEFMDYLEDLSDEEVGKLMRAVFALEANGELPEKGYLSPAANMLFKIMKNSLDYNRKKYAEKCETARRNGSKGGRPKRTDGSEENQTVSEETQKTKGFSEETKEKQTKAKKPDIDIDTDTVVVSDSDNESDIVLDSVVVADTAPAREKQQQKPAQKDAVILAYEKLIGPVTPRVAEIFGGYALTDELKIHAIEAAHDNNVRKISYIERILQGYIDGGVKSIEDAKRREAEHSHRRNQDEEPEKEYKLDEQAVFEMRRRMGKVNDT